MTKTQLVLVTAGVAALAGGGTALASKSNAQTGGSATHVGALAHHGGHGDDLEAAANAEATRLEGEYSKAVLNRLVAAGGLAAERPARTPA